MSPLCDNVVKEEEGEMKIKEILSQSRRDFKAIYICEHCGHEEKDRGLDSYDDTYFHKTVIPAMICGKCGKKAPDTYRPLAGKYPDWMQI